MIIYVEIAHLEGAGCNNGQYPAYRLINEAGEVVGEGVTCNCGRGCSGTDDVSEYPTLP